MNTPTDASTGPQPHAAPVACGRGGLPRRHLLLPTVMLLAACAARDNGIPAEPSPAASSMSSSTVVVSGMALDIPEDWTRQAALAEPSVVTESPAAEDEGADGTIQDVAVTWAARFVDSGGEDVFLVSSVFPAADLDQASALSRALVVEAMPGAVVRTSINLGASPDEGPVRLILDRGPETAVATAWTVPTTSGYNLVLLLVDDDQIRNTLEESMRQAVA